MLQLISMVAIRQFTLDALLELYIHSIQYIQDIQSIQIYKRILPNFV